MARTGIQQKRRRYVHKKTQDTSNAYVGSGGGSTRTGGTRSRADNALKKTQGYDSLTSERRETRGRKTGNSKRKPSTTGGAKARARSANRKQKARG